MASTINGTLSTSMATAREADAFGSGHGEVHASGPEIQSTAPGAPTANPPAPHDSSGESLSDASKNQGAEHWNYGGNPLAHQWSNVSYALAPNAAYLQPGVFREVDPKRANAAPLGLSGFALTTFVLSMVGLLTRKVFHRSHGMLEAPAAKSTFAHNMYRSIFMYAT